MPCTAKKTTQLIVEHGNDYVIAVKGNQPKLYHELQAASRENKPALRFTDVEKNRNRVTCRIVSVFDDIRGCLRSIEFNSEALRDNRSYEAETIS